MHHYKDRTRRRDFKLNEKKNGARFQASASLMKSISVKTAVPDSRAAHVNVPREYAERKEFKTDVSIVCPASKENACSLINPNTIETYST